MYAVLLDSVDYQDGVVTAKARVTDLQEDYSSIEGWCENLIYRFKVMPDDLGRGFQLISIEDNTEA